VKKLTIPSLLILVGVICTGCPFSSPYGLEAEPKEKVRQELLGTWVWNTPSDSIPLTIHLGKRTDYEYRLTIRGDLRQMIRTWTPETDSITLTAFTSKVAHQTFMNVISQSQYFLVQYKLEDGLLTLLPLSNDFNNKLIRDHKALKEIVSDHMKSGSPMYDQLTTIRGLVKQSLIIND
jgi:hypothetical protein